MAFTALKVAVFVVRQGLLKASRGTITDSKGIKEMPHIVDPIDAVTFIGLATPDVASHFERLLSFETDCWDVHEALKKNSSAFVLIDVRDSDSFALGHLPGAANLAAGKITKKTTARFPADALFVVYCTGPHCNGADEAAARFAKLGKRVKKMVGGVWGWKDYYGWPVESGR
jgi:rhodanese-related sulfurtransferase